MQGFETRSEMHLQCWICLVYFERLHETKGSFALQSVMTMNCLFGV